MDEIERLRRENAELRQALHGLHTHFDFAKPLKADE